MYEKYEAPVRPEDVLPAGVDSAVINGTSVRKGSIMAFVTNVKALDGLTAGTPDHDAVIRQIRQLAPAVRAIGMLDVFAPRSPELARLLDEVA